MSHEAIARVEESAGYLGETQQPIYCVMHHAAEPVCGVVVLVGPFAEEKKAAQRALVEAARAFAAAGFHTLLFDFSGTGDSPGEFAKCDISIWCEDIRSAFWQARRIAGDKLPVHVVGLRFGAALAWLALEDIPIDSLVLWEPILSGSTYLRQNRQRSQIRRELTNEAAGAESTGRPTSDESTFDFDGFAMSVRLQQEMAAIDLSTVPVPPAQRMLFLQISGSSRIRKPLEDLRVRTAESVMYTELESVAVEAFWSSIGLVDTAPIRDRTLDWMRAEWPAVDRPPSRLPERKPAPLSQLEVVQAKPEVLAEPLAFTSGEQRIHGVLYRPYQRVERAVILLHGWSGYRIGPGHLLTEAARDLAAAGYAAYSFDFRGRGESEWEVGEASLNSMIRDACRAVPIILEKTGASKVTLLGLCSGAEVALAAGLSDPRIDSLALWSAPVFSGAFTAARQLRRSRGAMAKYAAKLFRAETWSKLFSGRINFRMVGRALSGGRSNEDAGVVDKAPDTAAQMKEFEAFKGKLLFIYGGNDPETGPSREFYRAFVERTGMPHRFHEVAGANHNYYSMAWKREVIDTTLEWVAAISTQAP